MAPLPSRWPYLQHPGVLAFAHRGGAAEAPENTWRAFQAAVSIGYRYLETDARMTCDGVVLAFHDEDLRRLTGRPALVADTTWAEIQELTVDGEPIPRLEDLIAGFPSARFNIDAKDDRVVAPLADVITRTASIERVCVASFADRRLAAIRRLLGPTLCTSLGPRGTAWLSAARRIPSRADPATCVQVPARTRGMRIVTAGFVRAAHSRGVQVHVWTIDQAEEMSRLLDLGVDGLMTDRPTVLRDVLIERGEWPGPDA